MNVVAAYFLDNYYEHTAREGRNQHDLVPWLGQNTIFLARHGSHAYGTNTPTSDLDIKGVAVAPIAYHIGFLHQFEQANKGFKNDTCIFEVKKFLKLAAECNPNIIELLFLDDRDILHLGRTFKPIRDNRDLFLSRVARHRFTGYAVAQLKRIETHRRWILNPPKTEPTRRTFDLPDNTLLPKDQLLTAEDLVCKKLESWEVDLEPVHPDTRIALQNRFEAVLSEMVVYDRYDLAGRALGMDSNMLEVMKRERQYRQARADWEKYRDWMKTRNPARHALEVQFGYDTKHGMHLVRLMRMCREILETGKVLVRRPDAEELLAIRNGAWPYDKLIAWAKKEESEMGALAAHSPLPKQPPRERIDWLCQNVVSEFLGLNYGMVGHGG